MSLWEANAFQWAKDRARKLQVPFGIQPAHVQVALNQSSHHCTYCDIPLNFRRTTATRKDSPTLDRIIPKVGYTPENIVVCCYRCNTIKNNASPEELQNLSSRVQSLIASRKLDVIQP